MSISPQTLTKSMHVGQRRPTCHVWLCASSKDGPIHCVSVMYRGDTYITALIATWTLRADERPARSRPPTFIVTPRLPYPHRHRTSVCTFMHTQTLSHSSLSWEKRRKTKNLNKESTSSQPWTFSALSFLRCMHVYWLAVKFWMSPFFGGRSEGVSSWMSFSATQTYQA